MLEFLRRQTKTWVFKILFGLLILSFATWGIGDMVNVVATEDTVAEVGDTDVTIDELQIEYRRQLSLARTRDPNFEADEAATRALLDRIVAQLVSRSLLDEAAREIGVSISDETVRRAIQLDPNFNGITGSFDRLTFQRTLQNNQLSEARFVSLLRHDLGRRVVSTGVEAGISDPKSMARLLLAYQQKTRKIEALTFSADAVTDIPDPTDAELAAYHQENAARYTAPEYRAFAAVDISVEGVAKNLDVPEERIADAYDQRMAEFETPATRTVRQMVFQDEAKARGAYANLGEGEQFDVVAAALETSVLDLGEIARSDLPTGLQGPVFDREDPGLIEPTQSEFGWHVVEITAVSEGGTKPLEEVRDTLRLDIAREMAVDIVYDMSNALADGLAGGATLEEIATQLNVPLIKVNAVDSRGLGAEGQPVPGLPAAPEFLETVFKTDQATDSGLVITNDRYFVVRVDDITPPTLRPLDSMRILVTEEWKRQQQRDAAEAFAEAALEKARGGTPLSRIAETEGLTIETPPAFRRDGQTIDGTGLPPHPALVTQVFEANQGDTVIADTGSDYVIATVTEIIDAPAPDEAVVEQVASNLAGTIAVDMLGQFMESLRREYGATVNERLIDAVFQQ